MAAKRVRIPRELILNYPRGLDLDLPPDLAAKIPANLDLLPPNRLLQLYNDLIDFPHALIEITLRRPELFLSDKVNIARINAAEVVKDTKRRPLFSSVIEHPGTPLWLVRMFMNELETMSEGSINAVFPESWKLEPPLHTAVRSGRPDVVELLLQHPNINANMVYDSGEIDRPGLEDCPQKGFPHTDPCVSQSPRCSACRSAVEYGVDEFSRRPIDSELSRNIESCTMTIVAFGMFPSPLESNTQTVDKNFAMAVKRGMNRYVMAVLERLIIPTVEPYATNLINGGLENIFKCAAMGVDDNPVLQDLIDFACDLDIPLLPIDPRVVGGQHALERAITCPESNKPKNAIIILQSLLRLTSFAIPKPTQTTNAGETGTRTAKGMTAVEYISFLFENSPFNRIVGSDDGNHEYFVEHFRFIRHLLNRDNMSKTCKARLEQAREEMANFAIQQFERHEAPLNTIYAVHHGFATVPALKTALEAGKRDLFSAYHQHSHVEYYAFKYFGIRPATVGGYDATRETTNLVTDQRWLDEAKAMDIRGMIKKVMEVSKVAGAYFPDEVRVM